MGEYRAVVPVFYRYEELICFIFSFFISSKDTTREGVDFYVLLN